ncbi:MAG: OFA family MFS transporter [bacterium]|nr:OFA family MFS transporter [bacterium]
MDNRKNKSGWIVTLAATGIGLALGILYAWSVIKGGIPASWGWSNAQKVLPYSIACIAFSLAMIPAGLMQDKIGPRLVATVGGILVGLGLIVAGLSGSSLSGFVLGFGVLVGIGIGFGYSSATPPAVKWFPANKTGMIAGIVVAGFGLAPVYIAPLATWLLNTFSIATGQIDPATCKEIIEKGISKTLLTFGIGFLFVTVALAQFLKNPPTATEKKSPSGQPESPSSKEKSWKQMMSTPQFYILWLMYFAGAAPGLTFISFAQDLGKKSLGELAFLAVVVLAIGNAGGRVLAGIVSDKIGRQWTLFGTMLLQAGALSVLFSAQHGASWPILLLLLILIGANYGSNLALFPSASKDYFGLKNFGINYGFLFTAWGAAGLIMPWVNGRIKDLTGDNDLTFFLIIGMLICSAVLTFVSRRLAVKEYGH